MLYQLPAYVVGITQVANTASLGADYTSTSVACDQSADLFIQGNWTSTARGEFKLQGSYNNVIFADMLSTAITANAQNISNLWIVPQGLPFIRLNFIRTSGTGTLNAFVGQRTRK